MKRDCAYFLILLALAFTGCDSKMPENDDPVSQFCIPDSLMKTVTLDTIKAEPLTNDLKLSGKITFNEDNVVKVYPLVSGHVVEVKVSLGDSVQKGQLLAVIRSSDMAGYYNEYKSAQSELAIAKKNLDVTAEMKSSGISSDKDYLAAQSDYQKALSNFNKVNEVLKIYGSTSSENDSIGSAYLIRAPRAGFIVEKNINSGQELRADAGDFLFTISDLKEVWATANVYESDIAKIKVGSPAKISTLSYPDKEFDGKVERISNILDPETKVMSVKIKLSNADYTLKPGMFANVSILFHENSKMLAIPTKSLLYDDNKTYVVLFRKRCDVSMKEVDIYKSFNNEVYIRNDELKEGDLVVDRNGLFIFTALKKL